jgi:hypothetical protein
LFDLDELIANDQIHLGNSQAHAENVQGIFGRLAVGEFLLAVLHLEEIHEMGIAEAAHGALKRIKCAAM